MGDRVQLPRLTKSDVEGLMRAHQKVLGIQVTLKGTNWAGANACNVLAFEIDLELARIINKVELVTQRNQAGQSAPSPEAGEAKSSAAPADAQGTKEGE